MSDLRQRLARLEHQTGNGRDCPTCAELAQRVRCLRDDLTPYPGEPPDLCPLCGRHIPYRKVFVGVDPAEILGRSG